MSAKKENGEGSIVTGKHVESHLWGWNMSYKIKNNDESKLIFVVGIAFMAGGLLTRLFFDFGLMGGSITLAMMMVGGFMIGKSRCLF